MRRGDTLTDRRLSNLLVLRRYIRSATAFDDVGDVLLAPPPCGSTSGGDGPAGSATDNCPPPRSSSILPWRRAGGRWRSYLQANRIGIPRNAERSLRATGSARSSRSESLTERSTTPARCTARIAPAGVKRGSSKRAGGLLALNQAWVGGWGLGGESWKPGGAGFWGGLRVGAWLRGCAFGVQPCWVKCRLLV